MTDTVQRLVHVNQVGYGIRSQKRVVAVAKGGQFQVVDASNRVVFRGELVPFGLDPATNETVAIGDFSKLQTSGQYHVAVDGVGESAPFTIGAAAYEPVLDAALKSFYFQRCGIELDEQHAGPWVHAACHLGASTVWTEDSIDENEKTLLNVGGWHDAGDYGKYVVPAAKAVADLLLAYELYPQAFDRTINIPESGNGVPDVLNESRFELDWLLTMQDPATGGVYHKVTTAHFPSLSCMPEADTAPLWLSPISAAATADFAAITAMAARVYHPYDSEFADVCLSAAQRAWAWLESNPEAPGFTNPPEIRTGEYGDRNVQDERAWAAAELFRTTGEPLFRERLLWMVDAGGFTLYELGWASVGGYASVAYLLKGAVENHESQDFDKLYSRLLQGLMQAADEVVHTAGANGYGVALGNREYIWGSNMVVANRAMLLLIANYLQPNAIYWEVAANQMHYLLGTNTLDVCYLTGVGTNPVRFPHHRPSVGDGVEEAVPGLLSGGPNSRLQDTAAREKLSGRAPAACFLDDEDSYSTNEIAIYWNSPLVFALAGLVALEEN